MENKKNGFLNKKRNRSDFSKGPKGKGNFKNFKKNDDNKENSNNDEKSNSFNKGEFKKKYDKKYILGKLNKSADLKSRFNKNKNFQNKKNTESITHNNLNLTLTENLFNKAKKIYEEKSRIYDLEGDLSKNKDLRWTANILKTGTLDDKISSMSLLIKKDPKLTLNFLDMLLKMAKKKNRRHSESCITALKDLFLTDILSNKKLLNFYQNTENKTNLTDEELFECYVEDFVHKKYFEFIEIIEDIIINDPLKNIKKKYMNYVLEMLVRRPEREEKLLATLVNKLGDPDVEICSHAIKLLKNLQIAHMKMSLIILKNVQNFMANENLNANSKFYSLVYLSQMENYNNKDFIQYSINFFFDLFNIYTSKEDEENYLKHLSLVIKKISSLMKYCHEQNIKTDELIREKINTFFRLSHSESLKLRIQVLRLIFNIVKYENIHTDNKPNPNQNKKPVANGNNKNSEAPEDLSFLNRYYKSLYEILLNREIVNSKYLRDFLKLTIESLLFDTNNTRVCAFMKRLLSVGYCAEPPFIACILVIISQVLRNKNKLWKVVETPFSKTSEASAKFDNTKRDPQYTNADEFPLFELTILTNHYHPTVQKFSKFIIENYKKETINYEGDPLIDFSLINFLEKFILKNPKIKSDKHKKQNKEEDQAKKEDEEFRRFIGEKVEEDNTEVDAETNKGENFDFIKKFGEYEKLNKKAIKKKGVKKSEDIDDFADQVMEDEYAKYDEQHGGDVDEDPEFNDDEF